MIQSLARMSDPTAAVPLLFVDAWCVDQSTTAVTPLARRANSGSV